MYIFPVKPNTKFPSIGNWQELASMDLDTIERWSKQFPNCNWGVACGKSNLVVVDVDKDGYESLKELERQGLPETLIVGTPSGGKHLIYKGKTRNRVRMLPGIDIRSAGGYILKYGSQIEGKNYQITNNHKIVEAPTWLIEMIGTPKEKDKQSTPIDSVDNLIDARRAATYLASVTPAVEGEGGDQHTFNVACAVRDLGISEELCLELMIEHFNPRCKPEWLLEELKFKIYNAYRYAQNPLGLNSLLNKDSGFQDEREESLFEPISFFGHSYPPKEWICDTWIPKGSASVTLFTGDGATGKSLAALQLGVAVATGTEWFGFNTLQMPVLYLTCEDDKKELDRRVHAIRKEMPFIGVDSAPFHIMVRAGKESLLCVEQNGVAHKGSFYEGMDRALGEFKPQDQHGLWICDTVADVYAGNENIRSAVNGFLKNIIGGLAAKHNVTCLLIAHPSKQAGATYAGNTAWHNGVRNRLFLSWLKTHKQPHSKVRVLSHEKANHSAGANDLLLEWSNGLLEAVQQGDLDALVEHALVDAIRQAYNEGNPYSLSYQAPRYIVKQNICDHEGKPLDKELIKRVLQDLLDRGVIVQITGQKRGNGLTIKEEDS